MSEELEETPVYGGDTKPAMVKYFGLPIVAVSVFFVALVGGANLFGELKFKLVWIVIVLMVAAGFAMIIRRDHNALRIWARWFRSKFWSFDSRHWQGAALEPFPVRVDMPRGFFDD